MMKNKNEYVSIGLSRIIKSHGFDRYCNNYYDEFGINHTSDHFINWNTTKNLSSMPTLSEVTDWLLEEKNIFINITYYYGDDDRFGYTVIKTNRKEHEPSVILVSKNRHETKFSALEEALTKTFNKLDDTKKCIIIPFINKHNEEIKEENVSSYLENILENNKNNSNSLIIKK